MKRILAVFLILTLMAATFSACAEDGKPVVVVTSFYPVYLIGLNVLDGIENVQVHNLAAPGTGCLHDYQLSSRDMKELAKADCLLICGAGMESYLEMVYEAFPDLPVVSLSEGIELLGSESDAVTVGENETLYNSHVWLDPKNAAKMAENAAAGLMAVMPDKADELGKNAENFCLRMDKLDREIADTLSGITCRDIVTFHEAFPYFAKAYGLNVAAVVAREPGDALSAGQMAELVKVVRSLGNPPIFTEPQYDDMAAKTLARETGASVYQLDPVVTGPDVPPLDYYDQVMRENAKTVKEAESGRQG